MTGVFDLAAVIGIVAFAIGGVFATILLVAAGIRAEEKVARGRRSTTLHDEVTSDLTRGIRKLTGVGSRPRD